MTAVYRQSKGVFEFHNANPLGLLRAMDCVYRALATALDREWDDIYYNLTAMGAELKNAPNADAVFNKYLQDCGYPKQPQPRFPNGKKYTVEQFAKAYNYGSYVVSVANHLTCVKDGKILDTWDCSQKTVGNYWRIR